MQIRLASSLQEDSVVDGEGIRTVIWTQGCAHNCKGCHNPSTHSFDSGFLVDVEDVKEQLKLLEGQTGITLSGGDPIYQIEAVTEICKYAQSINLNVWLYTGFLYEEVLKLPKSNELLKYIDVMVDGMFKEEEKSLDAPFRGSKNQRVINVQESIKQNKCIVIDKYMNTVREASIYKKDPNIFI